MLQMRKSIFLKIAKKIVKMKTIKLFAAFALTVILSSPLLSAMDIKDSKNWGDNITVSTSANSVVVKLGNVRREVIEVKVLDENNNVLLTEKVKNTSNFIKKYNMERLLDGKYTLIVNRTTIRTVQPFTVEFGELKMSDTDKREEFIPNYTFEDGKLDVNAFLKQYGNITVNLYDNEGHQLLNKKYDNVIMLHERYNLSKLSNGFYILEVKAGNEFFSFNIVK